MTNAELAAVLRHIALLLDMDGVPFKPRAYEKAANAIDSVTEPLGDLFGRDGIAAIEELPGVGKSIAGKIAELIETGQSTYYEQLHRKVPVDLPGLAAIEGLGPKHIKTLYDDLGVRTVADLEAAALAGRIRTLPHFGEKSEQKILKGIGFVKASSGRFPLGVALPLVTAIAARLEERKGVQRVAVAGSLRRRKETIGDGDILVVGRDAAAIMDFVVAMPEVVHVHAKGPTKTSVKLNTGMDIDVRVVANESFGAALLYFTGSKAHNVELRKLAIAKKRKLNEYGVFRGEKMIAGQTEEEVYTCLGLDYVPPEIREDRGEIAAAANGTLPKLIDYGDVRGDLQTQTDWTDGADSIEAMVAEAKRLGREYIVITDHTQGLAMMGGCDEKKLAQQMRAIDKLRTEVSGITILKGAEVNINKDGTLDIADETLAQLDVVGVAVHSYFNLARAEQTRRIIRAMENPHADILFHPTGRVLQKRAAYELDIDAIIKAAKRTGTILEIDAHPERLDLNDDHVRQCVAAGVPLSIDTDAHSVTHLDYLHFGIAMARRGWATKADVVNTKPVKQFLSSLKKSAVP